MLRPFTTTLLITTHDWNQLKCPKTGTGKINCPRPAMELREVAKVSEKELYILLWRKQQDTLLKVQRKLVKVCISCYPLSKIRRLGTKNKKDKSKLQKKTKTRAPVWLTGLGLCLRLRS